MQREDETLSIVLFSGTDDRLGAAAVLAAGAAAMGRSVNLFLQYWGLDAFRTGKLHEDHGVALEGGPEGARLVRRMSQNGGHWSEVLRQAKDLGEVHIHACALSLDMFGITKDDLDPLVDDVEGVAAFMLDATGDMVFI
jgi:peroxiredoxin family protein